MTSYRCGCINNVDKEHGVLRSTYKCKFHRDALAAQLAGDPRTYYENICAIKADGTPNPDNYLLELHEALWDLQYKIPQNAGRVLEVGCGCSPYVGLLKANGLDYTGLEPWMWAAKWTMKTYDVPVHINTIENAAITRGAYRLVLAAHVLEHLENSPREIQHLYDLLHWGGEIIIIVPDDEDQTNPDHLWFYTEETLRGVLEKTKFQDVRMKSYRRVPHEQFIYCVARK